MTDSATLGRWFQPVSARSPGAGDSRAEPEPIVQNAAPPVFAAPEPIAALFARLENAPAEPLPLLGATGACTINRPLITMHD